MKIVQVMIRFFALAALYVTMARLGPALDYVREDQRVLLPQSGVAIAGLIILGVRYFPAITLASLIVSLLAGRPLEGSLIYAVGNTLAPATGAWLVRKAGRYEKGMLRVHDAYVFFFYGVLAAPFINALFASAYVYFFESAKPADLQLVIWKRWFGHGVSNLIVGPLLLTWARRPELQYPAPRLLETAFLIVALFGVSLTVFTDQSAIAALDYPVSFAPFPVVIWAALRYGPRGAATSMFIISAISIYGTSKGFGPFTRPERAEGLVLLQVYLIALALSALFLGSAMAERREAIRSLTASQDQLRGLSARLQQAREDERTVIAREIHDELGQQLTSIKMGLHAVMRRAAAGPEVVEEKCVALMEQADEAVQTVRQIAGSLRPGILDDLGLVAAMQWLVEDFQERTGVTCSFESDFDELSLPRDTRTALFRILQESLTNVTRHADAEHVEVDLTGGTHGVVLTIKDDGKGISEDALSGRGSLGLVGMRERANLLGGNLEIMPVAVNAADSSRRGTIVKAEVPVEQAGEQA